MSDYDNLKQNIRSRIEANEGDPRPSAEELWHRASLDARSAAGWIDDMPVSEHEVQTVKSDLLKALVALEMAEESLNEGASDDE